MKSRQLVPIVLAAAWLFVGCSQEAPTTSVEMPDSPSASLLATQAEKPASVSDSEAPSGDLATRLGLSDAQQAALKALKTEQKAETQAALKAAKESKDRKALRDELKALRDRHHAAFLALLTDAQKATYDELKAARAEQQAKREQRQAEMKKRIQQTRKSAEARRVTIEDQLGLDAGQRAALRALRLKHSADGKEIAQEARETKADRETVKKEYEALRNAFDKAFREILTDEQEAKYDQIVAERKSHGKAT